MSVNCLPSATYNTLDYICLMAAEQLQFEQICTLKKNIFYYLKHQSSGFKGIEYKKYE